MYPGHPTIYQIVADTRMNEAYREAEHARRVAEARRATGSTTHRPGAVSRTLGDLLVRVGERIQGPRHTQGAEASNPPPASAPYTSRA